MRKDRRSVSPILRAAADDGLIGTYQPAVHAKAPGLLARAAAAIQVFRGKPIQAETTTQQGSGAASPSTYWSTLLSQRYDRRSLIQDARMLLDTDPRISKATRKFCDEAVRKGAAIAVDFEQSPAALGKKAAEILADVQTNILRFDKLSSWALALPVEGDLFLQAVLNGTTDRLVQIKRMPAVAMERLSDDCDEFQDPMRAYAQIDTATNLNVAIFPEALMHHARWNHWDGDRYGVTALAVVRRQFRLLWIMEEAQVIRRVMRAAQRRFWKFGGKDGVVNPNKIEEFKQLNGFVEGNRDPYDPMNVALDSFGGNVECQVLDGDKTIHEIEDLKNYQNVAASGLLTPHSLYGLDSEAINRDVLEEQRAEWLKEVQKLADMMVLIIRWVCDLALTVAGVDPAMITYTVTMSDSSPLTAETYITTMIALYEAGGLTLHDLVRLTAEFTGVANVDEQVDKLKTEAKAKQDMEVALQKATMANKPVLSKSAKDMYDRLARAESYMALLDEMSGENGHNHVGNNGDARQFQHIRLRG